MFSPESDGIGLKIHAGGVVGAVPLRTPDSRRVNGGIVVRPRLGWKGIGPLLARIGWSAHPRILDLPLVPGSTREVPPWVLAGPALQRLAALVNDLSSGFQVIERVPASPRGQLLWGTYLTRYAAQGAFHRLPCRYPDLGPNETLRSYLRWGIETLRSELAPHATDDGIARGLWDLAESLLVSLRDTPARRPDRRALEGLARSEGLPSQVLANGLTALGWIADGRGLAGRSESDGLAWALVMHELFERWVEHLVRCWTHRVGAQVLTGRTLQTAVPIRWQGRGRGSLTNLVPDLVVRRGEQVMVFDAKYKDHLEELEESQWTSLAEEVRAQHRQDIHQVLAYAGLFEARQITAALVYPMRAAVWERLNPSGRTLIRAELSSGGREVCLALAGVPMQADPVLRLEGVTAAFDALLAP